jgi:hypothetical protein
MTYTHDDAEDARRKLNTLLASGCRAHTGVYNDGKTLGIVVASKAGKSKLYEFGWTCLRDDTHCQPAPPFTDLALLQVVAEWKSGDLEEPPASAAVLPENPAYTGPVAKEVCTRDDFLDWLRTAKPGAHALYHRGSVANYRKDGPIRLIELQRLSDNAKPSHPRPPGESVEMQQIQDRLELITTVSGMVNADMVRLIQRRTVEGGEGEFIYYAVKKGR